MSVTIETTDELQQLLRKLGVKITSVEELRHLLATINANYNPEAARARTAKLVAISVPCTLGSIAGVVSVVLASASPGVMFGPYLVGAFALIWGSCALVSAAALIFSLILVAGRRSRVVSADKPTSERPATIDERVLSAFPRDLSL